MELLFALFFLYFFLIEMWVIHHNIQPLKKKETRELRDKPKVSRRKKDQSKNKWNRNEENHRKDQWN